MIIVPKGTLVRTTRKLDLTPKKRVSYLYDNRTGLPLSEKRIKQIEAKNAAEAKQARARR